VGGGQLLLLALAHPRIKGLEAVSVSTCEGVPLVEGKLCVVYGMWELGEKATHIHN
jgi:hypothetical protein